MDEIVPGERSRGSPIGRLETWLVKVIQGGKLKRLPLYYPLGEQVGRHPEQFARDLLTRLRSVEGHPRALERLRDDGRAFRSWAEFKPLAAPSVDQVQPTC